MSHTLTAAHLLTDDGVIDRPLITVEDGLIQAIETQTTSEAPQKGALDLGDTLITAGLLDIHMHGCAGRDVMEATPEALGALSSYLARHGVTEYLATTVTAPLDLTLRALDGLGSQIVQGGLEGATAAGIHIEGPFVSHAKRGMHPSEHILPPSPALLDRLWAASHNQICLMTIAPEVPGAIETIRRAAELGIRTSIGHSDADTTTTIAAIAAGATTATHTFNAMRTYGHREPGILGVVLDDDSLYSDLICDGVHVSPQAVRLWFKAKGKEKAILITDSLQATGMPNGLYTLGTTRVHVADGICTTDEGVLAGSIITLQQAVQRFREFTGTDVATAVQLASRNPTRMLGRSQQIAVGKPANFNMYSRAGAFVGVVLRGRLGAT